MRLDGQRMLIIGGSSGIGLGVARAALAAGAAVTIVGRTRDKLAAARAELDGKPDTVQADAGDVAAVQGLVRELGELDHLVTTAAELAFAPFAKLGPEQVERGLRSKIWAPFFAAQAAAERMRRGGSITFFSGAAAYRPGPGTVLVATVNAALEGLAKALAVELAPIRVNVVSPGVVDTPVWAGMPADQRKGMFDQVAARLPARRIGTVDDLAAAVMYAATNGFVTGTVLHVDGGARLA